MNAAPDSAATARRISEAAPGRRANVYGTVSNSVTVRVGSSPSFTVTLVEGDSELDLIFLARPLIRGFTIGTECHASGRVAVRSGRIVIWNPHYRLDTSTLSTAPIGPAFDASTAPAPTLNDDASSGAMIGTRTTRAPSGAIRVTDSPGPAFGEVAPTGRFRIYLGPAAGVGKTCAMLDEGHRRQARGRDVVAAIVETHGRAATAAKLAGLEIIPPKTVTYRGRAFQEMDLDAVLARRPDVALVDELAHTNVPGSGRNDKRWQDVLELLGANISVISTVNVQHIESLADVAEQVSGVAIRERVPDAVLRRASQIELVDSSPEQLRRRMLHGNIYPPERARQALTGFFRTDTLAALREIALRFLADDVDEDLLHHLQRMAPGRPWDTAERIIVAVTGSVGSATVLRRAARIASRLKAGLHAVHVRPGETDDPARGDIQPIRRLAEQLGATWIDIVDDDPARAIMKVASDQKATQIVLGRSMRSRWQRLFGRNSTVRRITKHAMTADIDLHIVAHDLPDRHPPIGKEPPLPGHRP